MRINSIAPLLFFLLLLTMPSLAQAEGEKEEKIISGLIGISGKYDSNLEITSSQAGGGDQDDDFICELAAQFAINHSWGHWWHLEFDVNGLADWLYEFRDETWYVGNGNLYLGYTFGNNTISVLNNSRYFTEPRNDEFDFFRNSATLAFKRILSRLWQARIGYENINNLYLESTFFNYYLNGGFVEFRNTWTPLFSTYYSYDFLYYIGSFNAQRGDPLSSPEAGYRHTGEVGFEWLFARKNSLNGAYAFQVDDSSSHELNQIGEFEGEQDSLEVDAEFNFIKHKGTLLFSHKFNERFSLSLYEEIIHKTFLERNSAISQYDSERVDLLFLSSVWFTARLHAELYSKARYLYRMNDSTFDSEDFQNHIFSLGLEYRF